MSRRHARLARTPSPSPFPRAHARARPLAAGSVQVHGRRRRRGAHALVAAAHAARARVRHIPREAQAGGRGAHVVVAAAAAGCAPAPSASVLIFHSWRCSSWISAMICCSCTETVARESSTLVRPPDGSRKPVSSVDVDVAGVFDITREAGAQPRREHARLMTQFRVGWQETLQEQSEQV